MERKYKILIVDDESDIRTIYADFFRKRDFEVETASSGEEGLSKLREGKFDVAIVDILMPPGINGIEMIQRAKQEGIYVSTIILTGHGGREEAVEAVNLGVDYWFDKAGIDMSKLRDKVVELAEGIPLDEIEQILSSIPAPDETAQ